MDIKLLNTSRYLDKKGNTHWWVWTIFIKCDEPKCLEEIDFVEYHLHPTFRNPIQRVRKKEGGFPLTMKGWGVFNVRARVIFKDKREPVNLAHRLEFVQPAE
jgi:transcription initiation factor IIF auxiliary subunit